MPPKRTATGEGGLSKKFKEDEASAVVVLKAINTIRILAADIVQKAKSGHPGAPMGCAPMAFALFARVMNYSPSNPKWWGRDRFVLSNGHACALLYTMLHLTGYDLSMDDLKQFRQLDSKTAGHPENFVTPGVEVSTGPLGQGISNAVGMAVAEAHLAAEFNKPEFKVIDNYTYVICGDGCLQEGVSSEASSLAGHLGLGKLIVLYDDNQITIDGSTEVSFTEDVLKRYEAYGWHTSHVPDVKDLSAVLRAIDAAKAETGRPSIIKITTVIGYGSIHEGEERTHGAALGDEDVAQVKTRFGFDPTQMFHIPPEVSELFKAAGRKGEDKERDYNGTFQQYKAKYPQMASELTRRMEGRLPEGWKEKLPSFTPEDPSKATRAFSAIVLNVVADMLPELVGGSADLTGSNLTALKNSGDFQKDTPLGRYMRFGVREHGMSAIVNGMHAYGGLRTFAATFLNFITYGWGSVRLSALSRFGVIYIMTHDSIGLGEDGPTHQPIETLELLRATPNMLTFRPADGNEVSGAYACAVEASGTPSVLALSRGGVVNLEGSSVEAVSKGAYNLCEHGTGSELPALIIASTGTEVQLCVSVAKALASSGVKTRVVSMPCWELFEDQSEDYQLEVFPVGVPVMSVEAAGIQGWQRWAHAPFGLNRFGASAPGKACNEKFGFSVDNLTTQGKKVVEFYKKNGPAQSLVKRVDLSLTGYHNGH